MDLFDVLFLAHLVPSSPILFPSRFRSDFQFHFLPTFFLSSQESALPHWTSAAPPPFEEATEGGEAFKGAADVIVGIEADEAGFPTCRCYRIDTFVPSLSPRRGRQLQAGSTLQRGIHRGEHFHLFPPPSSFCLHHFFGFQFPPSPPATPSFYFLSAPLPSTSHPLKQFICLFLHVVIFITLPPSPLPLCPSIPPPTGSTHPLASTPSALRGVAAGQSLTSPTSKALAAPLLPSTTASSQTPPVRRRSLAPSV